MADDSTNGTMEEHLEDIASPGTQRTLRRVRRANQSSSANPPSGSELWQNADAAITSRHQQPQQQQQTQEQRKSAAEQEQVLVAASLRRSAAAKSNNHSAFGINADDDSNGIDDVISMMSITSTTPAVAVSSIVLKWNQLSTTMQHAAIMEVVDENNNGTFIIDGIDYRFRWKNWSNWFVVPPPPPSY